MSKSHTTKPPLSVLTQQDSGKKLITPSSRTHHLHSTKYKVGKPVPTFFNVDDNRDHTTQIKGNDPNSRHIHDDNDQDAMDPQFNVHHFAAIARSAATAINPRAHQSEAFLDSPAMRARYEDIRTQSRTRSTSLNSTKSTTRSLMKRGGDKERAQMVAKDFIQREMTKLAYDKYIRSPFAFIDRVDNGDIPQTEFVYLNENGPYDLEIVSSQDLSLIDNDNYYTLSAQGLTHFHKGQVLFTPLDQWQREYYLFTSMMNIPFFNQYKKWKTFRSWKKSIQKDKVRKCNNVMNGRLFILNKHLRGPLFEIRKLCCSITEWKLFIFSAVQTKKTPPPLTLKEFLELQTTHRVVLKGKLESMCQQIKVQLLSACENRLKHHLLENGFDTVSEQNAANDHHVSHAQRAAIRTECRSLTKFIKMVDNFIQDAVMSLCRQNVKALLKYIENVQRNYKRSKNMKTEDENDKEGVYCALYAFSCYHSQHVSHHVTIPQRGISPHVVE